MRLSNYNYGITAYRYFFSGLTTEHGHTTKTTHLVETTYLDVRMLLQYVKDISVQVRDAFGNISDEQTQMFKSMMLQVEDLTMLVVH